MSEAMGAARMCDIMRGGPERRKWVVEVEGHGVLGGYYFSEAEAKAAADEIEEEYPGLIVEVRKVY